jgi:mannose-6-phosphate isomerase class I
MSETLLLLDSILSYNGINSIPTNESSLRDFEWTTQEQYISTENYLSIHGFEDFQNCSLDSNSFIDQLESSDNQQSRKRDFSSINTEYYTNNYLQEKNQLDFAFEPEPELFDYLYKIQDVDFYPRKRKKIN